MPLLKLETTVVLSEDKRKALLVSLSKAVTETIGKPEQYVMVTASQAAMVMSGKPGDAAFVDIRSIGGLSDDVNPVDLPEDKGTHAQLCRKNWRETCQPGGNLAT